MALDQSLFEAFIENSALNPSLRIYQVSEPALSVGTSYRKRRGLLLGLKMLSALKGKAVPICVRPTGGGVVEHGNDLIYSVIAKVDTFPTFRQVRTSYLSFHEAVQTAFERLGIETRLFRCDEARARNQKSLRGGGLNRCFEEPVATDVLVKKQKIAGGAQRRKGGAFLHQGSIQIPQGISYGPLKSVFLEAFKNKFEAVFSSELT